MQTLNECIRINTMRRFKRIVRINEWEGVWKTHVQNRAGRKGEAPAAGIGRGEMCFTVM